jgi:hypothetical protein
MRSPRLYSSSSTLPELNGALGSRQWSRFAYVLYRCLPLVITFLIVFLYYFFARQYKRTVSRLPQLCGVPGILILNQSSGENNDAYHADCSKAAAAP